LASVSTRSLSGAVWARLTVAVDTPASLATSAMRKGRFIVWCPDA
jgi:hypothetical protein